MKNIFDEIEVTVPQNFADKVMKLIVQNEQPVHYDWFEMILQKFYSLLSKPVFQTLLLIFSIGFSCMNLYKFVFNILVAA